LTDGDITAALKWRFLGDKERFQFAIKPSLTFPTGNEEKGLGIGQSSPGGQYYYKFDRQSYGVTIIGTYDQEDWCMSANAGYQHNRYGLHPTRTHTGTTSGRRAFPPVQARREGLARRRGGAAVQPR
jgi:hypothetical protein